MSLADYSHIVTIGSNCTPSYQLARAAWRWKLPEARILGPFDWFGVDIPQALLAIEAKFRDYFVPEKVSCEGHLGQFWKITDAGGIQSWHHLHRADDATEPSHASWYTFGRWLGQRLSLWERTLGDSQARLLLVRAEDAARPDALNHLTGLREAVASRAKCEVVLAAISYSARLASDNPRLRTFEVCRSWPAGMECAAVNWDHDYGCGPAWQGHGPSWAEVWSSV
jgi:hypothetical protein